MTISAQSLSLLYREVFCLGMRLDPLGRVADNTSRWRRAYPYFCFFVPRWKIDRRGLPSLARFEECGLRQHSYHPLLNHPRLGLLNLQHVAENDHGLGTNYQRERSAWLAVRGFVEAVARRARAV